MDKFIVTFARGFGTGGKAIYSGSVVKTQI